MTADSVQHDAATGTARPPLRARMSYQGLLLGGVCLVVTVVLLIGFRSTRAAVEAAAERDKLQSLNQVLPASLYDNNPIRDVQTIHDPQLSEQPVEVYRATLHGALTAVAYQVTRPGYSGPITLIMAIDVKGNILGVRVLSQTETPGLGDRIDISKSKWITYFKGHSLSNTSSKAWHVKKDGGEFDQFTGATITPRAVVGAVHQGLLFGTRHFSGAPAQPVTTGNDGVTRP